MVPEYVYDFFRYRKYVDNEPIGFTNEIEREVLAKSSKHPWNIKMDWDRRRKNIGQ